MSFSVTDKKTWRIAAFPEEHKRSLILLSSGFVPELAIWNVKNCIQQFWVLWYNFAPGASCISGGKCHELTPDKIILIPPHTPYSGKLDFTVPHFFVWFQCSAPFDAPENRVLEIPVEPYRKQFEQVIEQDSRTVSRLANLAERLLLDIPEEFFQGKRSSNSQTVEQAVEFIIRNSGAVTNAEIAEHLGISSSRFAHLFKSTLGISPQRYCLQIKMSYAEKNLLIGKDIKETADMCGFADRFHFSKEFKKFHGISPGKWLRQFSKLAPEKQVSNQAKEFQK